MPKKKTHEQFIKEISAIAPKIEILGDYINTNTKIHCRCLVDSYEWNTTPHLLLEGKGCPLCGGTKRKTHEEFCTELNKVNTNIIILNEYKNFKTKVRCKCNIDGYEWEAFPQNLIRGHGCPECNRIKTSQRLTKSHDCFVAEIAKINDTVEILGKYINNQSYIKCRCKKCSNIWETRAYNLMQGKACPKCGVIERANKSSKSHDTFVKEMYSINDNIEVIGKYVNSETQVLCKCKIDGYEWSALPSNLLKGTGCPKCCTSHGEKAVLTVLDDIGIDYLTQYRFKDCKNIRGLPFDFYLPDLDICIEYDGQQHFRPVKFGGCSDEKAIKLYNRTLRNDYIKNKFCQENDIKLIRIKFNEFKQIRDILEKEISFS